MLGFSEWSDVVYVLKGAIAMQLMVWIVSGITLVVASAAATATFFYHAHHRSEYVSVETAEAELQRTRLRFAGQRPLIDMQERRLAIDGKAPSASAKLQTLHVLIFDTRGGQRLVRISVPYRLGRLLASRSGFRWLGQLTFLDDTEFDPEPIQLSLDQVARRGPGLLVDYRHASGGQFMAWAE